VDWVGFMIDSDGWLRFWDIPLGGHSFTRITSNGEKLSKLDRFLISEDIPNVIHNLQATVIDCHILDHRPIVLKQSKLDFGPTPFKLFNSWMLNPQFDALVTLSWNSAQHLDGSNPFIHFKEKMKRLKYDIKNWSRQAVNSRHQEQDVLRQQINHIELNIEAGHASSEDKLKRRSLAINGIMKDGIWITDPNQIKDTVISEQEIRDAVWACGSDKSPGPDGFLFSFIKKYWDVLKPGILAFILDFYSSGYIPQGCNSSFITLIPKLNSPTVVSDFRPISLIGAQYKIIAKILANRLSQVIDSIISPEQTAFIRDDVLILGKWSSSNIHGVNSDDVRNLASLAGCKSQLLPFIYLGLPVGMNMSRLKGWDPILTKFKNRLSKWKASMLSIGGRSTLVSSVLGPLGIYYLSFFLMSVTIANSLEAMRVKFFWGYTDEERKMQWIEWKSVLASKKYGGLGIGSLQALNLYLIQK
ncbi:hypothetical protein Tco_0328319, partial [Tanacetum coccineum]